MQSVTSKIENTRQYSIHEKLKLSLNKLLDMNYDVTDDSILSKLSSFLANLSQEESSLHGNVYDTIYEQWLLACIAHWKDGTLKPTIAVFSIQILSIICQDPAYFALLNSGEQNILKQFKDLIASNLTTNPLFPIAYAKLLSSCIVHDQGLKYVLEDSLWKQVLSIYISNESMYVKKECKEFLISLCISVCEKNLEDAAEMTALIFELYETHRQSYSIFAEKSINKKYTQTLNLLISILEAFLLKKEFQVADKYFISRSSFCEGLWSDLSTPHCDETLIKISKLLVLSRLISFASSGTSALDDALKPFFEEFLLKILRIFQDKESLREIAIVCEVTVKYCKLNDSFVNNSSFLENLFVIRLIPVLTVVDKQCRMSEAISDEFDFPPLKLVNISLWEPVNNFCIQYKRMLNSHSNLDQIAISCITAMDSEFEIPSLHYRLLIFKVLTSLFHEHFVPKDISLSDPFSNTNFIHNRLTSALLLLLRHSVKKFSSILSCRVEVFEVLPDLVVFLSIPGQSSALSTLALNLIYQILEILPDNASVEIINIIKSVMPDLQKVLSKYMYSISWEVRDSAMEVLSCVADVSLKKIKFEKPVVSLQLANDVFAVFSSDNEYYVRATAIACLCKLVQIKSVWSRMDQANVLQTLLDALKTEDEAIVRRQIPLLLKEVYEHSNFSDKMLTENLYPALVHSSIKDLHWEVCVNSLDFWQSVIMKHLQIPPTIAVKSVPDIRSFFVKQLTYLNNLGCFLVIVKCLHDEADLEVSKKAATILYELSTYLNKFLDSDVKHRVNLCQSLVSQSSNSTIVNSSQGLTDSNTDVSSTNLRKLESGVSDAENNTNIKLSDKVIESIVGSTDISLLANVYKGSISDFSEPVTSHSETSSGTVLSETELINMFTKINVAEIIENKVEFFRQAQNNLESLLNDILLPGFNNSQNPTLDCY